MRKMEREVTKMLHTVVKGTRTITEYKQAKADMERLTNLFYQKHLASTDRWTDGVPVKVWYEDSSTLCVQYESGIVYYYDQDGNRK